MRFDGGSIEPLRVAKDLQLWLEQDLGANRIPLDQIRCAELTVDLAFSEIDWDEQTRGEQFFEEGRRVRTPTLHRCRISCRSVVATTEAEYRSSYEDLEELPPGWPAA